MTNWGMASVTTFEIRFLRKKSSIFQIGPPRTVRTTALDTVCVKTYAVVRTTLSNILCITEESL